MTTPDVRKTLAWLLKSAALLATWAFILFILAMFTEFIMAPWDTAITQPDIGTWQRTLNDFFDLGPGQWLVATAVVLGNVYVAIRLWLKRNRLPWRFIVNNALFVWLLFPLMMLAFRLNNVIFPYPDVLYDPNYRGYHLSVIPGTVALAVIAIWFMVQSRLQDQRKRKRQVEDVASTPDVSRLADGSSDQPVREWISGAVEADKRSQAES